MASFYRRSPGQWEARVKRAGFPSQNKTWRTKARAIAWARKVEGQMDAATFVDTNETKRLPLRDLIARYRTEVVPRLADAKEKGRILDAIGEKFGSYGVLHLDARTIARWRDELARTGAKRKAKRLHR